LTKLLTIPVFARETGLPDRLCLQPVQTGDIPSARVGSRRRIHLLWVEQWLADGGYRPDGERRSATEDGHGMLTSVE
jgi:hypothetical protein